MLLVADVGHDYCDKKDMRIPVDKVLPAYGTVRSCNMITRVLVLEIKFVKI